MERPLSMYLGPEEVILVLPVTFAPDLSAVSMQDAIGTIKEAVQLQFPVVKRIVVESQKPM